MTRTSRSREEMRDGSRLREVVSSQRGASRECEPEDIRPRSTYEAVTREMVRSLTGEVRDVKYRINQLLTLLIGAILLEVLMRLIGV